MSKEPEVIDEDGDDCDNSQAIFDLFSSASEGHNMSDVVAAAIDMVVACVKESEDEDFAKSVVAALLDAAQFLALTGASNEPEEQSVIQLLN